MRALPLLLGAMACSASAPKHTAPTIPTAPRPAVAAADTCPLDLDGASLEVQDTELGVALAFTSYGDVSELRRRVRLLGDVKNATTHHRFVEDVEGGARIVFPAELRGEVVAVAQHMEAGACPIALPTSADDRVVSR